MLKIFDQQKQRVKNVMYPRYHQKSLIRLSQMLKSFSKHSYSIWKRMDRTNIKGSIKTLSSVTKSACEKIAFDTNGVDFAMDNNATARERNEKSLFKKILTNAQNGAINCNRGT